MKPIRRLAFLFVASILGAAALSAQEHEFVPIFDGETLDGWDGADGLWRVEDGAITGETTAERPARGNTFLIWRLGEVDDFELELRYRIFAGNSGVQYRSEHLGDFVVKGHQADIEAGDRWSGAHYDERGRGILAARGERATVREAASDRDVQKIGDSRELQSFIERNGWNVYRITARGRRMIHAINGHVMSDVTDDGIEAPTARRSGILALQLHAGPPMKVQFKDIRLKRLPLDGAKKIVLVAGRKSHGYGAHEHNAGCKLLARLLNENVPGVLAATYHDDGWPEDPTAFDNADAVMLYMDGGDGHPANRHLDEIAALTAKGVGFACIHYGVEVPKGAPGERFLDAIGGYFETDWSVNPHWIATFESFPDHPIARGVAPFTINDEWYYHMRFRPEMEGVTPILTAIPPDATRQKEHGPHSGNPHVAARLGQPEHVAWAVSREDGGRGFGITGAHFHWNWGHDQFRKLVLNALVWVAGAKVPPGGVATPTLTVEDLEANQDYPKPERFDRKRIENMLETWNGKE